MITLVRTLSVVFLLGLAAYLLAGCHTVEGVGKDVEALGSGIAEGAKEVNPSR